MFSGQQERFAFAPAVAYPLPMDAASLSFSSLPDDEVRELLKRHSIGLTVEEARKVETMLGRPPSVVEAVIWGIQGSEHCSYKSSRRFLKMFHTKGKHVILGPGEDSGIVAITDGPPGKRWGIVVSHESHNHPSQIVPFEGAATGVGGTVRDVVCMGARVIGCMDMLRLGDLKTDESRSIAKEVFRGIAGYGNPLGVPNVGGDTVFDSSYNANCLVNATAIGLVREDEIIRSFVPEEAAKMGYDIIIVGKPTDRSGFGGAAFASVSMEEDKKEQNTGAVQEPNPFLERHLLLSTYALFDWLIASGNLPKISFKDLGAGGVVCSSVEQVASRGFGADIDLEKVHVSIPDLPPEVIGCAETQERFCWMCHPDLTQTILKHYNETWDLPSVAENARASVIGKVTADGLYRLRHKGQVVCEAKSEDITSGLLYTRPTAAPDGAFPDPVIACDGATLDVKHEGKALKTTVSDVFKALLHHPNHASKYPAILHYDKSVIGNGVIEAGEADASVLAPLRDLQSYIPGGEHPGWDPSESDRNRGVAFAGDGNARYGKVSAYLQGANAATEAVCNLAATGAEARALTDCLNYGNPEIPAHLGALEQGVKGIADACAGLGEDGPVPVISGNVSLYNSLPDGSAIPPSAIVCSIGVLENAADALPVRVQRVGSSLVLLGERRDECGASAYYEALEVLMHSAAPILGTTVPKPVFAEILPRIKLLRDCARNHCVLASHDISDGGLLLCLYEMLLPVRKIGGVIGAEVDLDALASSLRSDTLLFSQTQGFVVEVPADRRAGFEALAKTHGVPWVVIGTTVGRPQLTVKRGKTMLIDESLRDLGRLWDGGLSDSLAGR